MKSNQIYRSLSATLILLFCFSIGCGPPPAKQAKKKDAGGIIGKTTKLVTEWDPDAGREVVVEDLSLIHI